MRLRQILDGVTWTTLATNTSAGSTANQWYDVQVVMDRGKIEVWRRAQGAGSYYHVFTVTNNSVTEMMNLRKRVILLMR